MLIKEATELGLTVGSCKHHGHGVPDVVQGTDSFTHQRAGAVISGVEGEGVLNLSITKKFWDLQGILAFYKLIQLDWVIVEGFKNELYPKIVLIRNEQDLKLIEELNEVVCVLLPGDCNIRPQEGIHYFDRSDHPRFLQWFRQYITESKMNIKEDE